MKCHAGTKEKTKKLNFFEFCQDIYLDIVVTYLLAHAAWEKYIKWTQSNDTNTLSRFYFYVPFLQGLPRCIIYPPGKYKTIWLVSNLSVIGKSIYFF